MKTSETSIGDVVRRRALFSRIIGRIGLLQYRKSVFIYLGMKAIVHMLPFSNVAVIPTPYGKFIMPKTARILSTMVDIVEPQAQEFFHESVRNSSLVIDVGAAHGWYTLKAARIMGGSEHVLSIEPDERSFAILSANMPLNRLKNVTAVRIALSDVDGYIKLGDKEVRCKRLDSLLCDLDIGSSVDFVKIDVEGMALKVLRGAKKMLKLRKPKLLVELHKGEENVLTFLREHNYKIELLPGHMLIAY